MHFQYVRTYNVCSKSIETDTFIKSLSLFILKTITYEEKKKEVEML